MSSKFLSLLFAASLSIASMLCFAGADGTQNYHLEGVGDGDTIYVRTMDNKVSYRVRFAMIDAPEKSQEYGMAAKSQLLQLLSGAETVSITSYGFDRYGRIIGMVESNGRNMNLEMVAAGAAWVYDTYASKPQFASYKSSFDNALKQAKASSRGLWATKNPLAPWKFRRN